MQFSRLPPLELAPWLKRLNRYPTIQIAAGVTAVAWLLVWLFTDLNAELSLWVCSTVLANGAMALLVAGIPGSFSWASVSALVFWNTSLVLRSWDIAHGVTGFDRWGNMLYVLAALPAMFLLRKFGAQTAGMSNKAVLVGMDVAFVALCWLLGVWRYISPEHNSFGWDNPYWGVMIWCYVHYVMLSFMTMMVVGRPNLVAISLLLGMCCVHVGDVIAWMATWDKVLPWMPISGAMFMNLAWLFIAYSVLKIARGEWHPETVETDSKEHNIVVSCNAGIALLAAAVDALHEPVLDPISIAALLMLVIMYSTREYIRGAYNQRLISNYDQMARVDQLTGVGNRQALTRDLQGMTNRKQAAGLSLIDVDGFHAVNEHYSHRAGDQLLMELGESLRDFGRQVDIQVYRISGNEFALLIPGYADRAGYVTTAARRVLAGVLDTRYPQLQMTTSAGFVWHDSPGVKASKYVTEAAEALRIAKDDGNRAQGFTAEIAADVERRSTIERSMRQAIADHAMSFHYQPVVDTQAGEVIGLEALARWHDPVLGNVSPVEFVPVAERTELIHDLGISAIRDAVGVVSELKRAGYELFVTVNVSPIQLRAPGFREEIRELLARSMVDPAQIKLELTENIFIDEDDPANATVRAIAQDGFSIALDDFGHGYTSIEYLSRMPYNAVKLDRTITLSRNEPAVRSIIKALAITSTQRGVMVIAEGVEDTDVVADLHALGVTVGQGWLWSKAVPATELLPVLAKLGARRAVPAATSSPGGMG